MSQAGLEFKILLPQPHNIPSFTWLPTILLVCTTTPGKVILCIQFTNVEILAYDF